MGRFDRPGLRRIETLDYVHAAEHLWTLGAQLHGANTPEAQAFARPLADTLKHQGADPVLTQLYPLLPGSSDAAGAAIIAALDYLEPHSARGRTDYPTFAAEGLDIASGTVESSCRTVVCQRTKSPGMRWRRRGAQSILALRCLFLTPSRSEDFFHRKPCLRRPPVATLRTDNSCRLTHKSAPDPVEGGTATAWRTPVVPACTASPPSTPTPGMTPSRGTPAPGRISGPGSRLLPRRLLSVTPCLPPRS